MTLILVNPEEAKRWQDRNMRVARKLLGINDIKSGRMDIHKQYDDMMKDVARFRELEGASRPMFDKKMLDKVFRELDKNRPQLHASKKSPAEFGGYFIS
jgi:hypothetical protein